MINWTEANGTIYIKAKAKKGEQVPAQVEAVIKMLRYINFNITVDGKKFVVSGNPYKQEEKQPDMKVFKDDGQPFVPQGTPKQNMPQPPQAPVNNHPAPQQDDGFDIAQIAF